MDKASIITATFSTDSKNITLDPGFVGEVKVNGKPLLAVSTVSSSGVAPVASANGSNVIATPSVVKPTPGEPEVKPTPGTVANVPGENGERQNVPAPEIGKANPAAAGLGSEYTKAFPKAKIVVLSPSQHLTQKDIIAMAKSSQVAQKPVYWAEPVTPPNPSEGVSVGPTEMKLAEVRGDVKVISPLGEATSAKDAMTVTSSSRYELGENSSAAILIGGVDSVRLTPFTTATITSKLEGGVRTTLIDLQEGIVFNKVGQRDGEKQDYRVKSPVGVAAARGTDFANLYHDGHFVTMGVQGAVGVSNSGGAPVGLVAPGDAHTPAYFALGGNGNQKNNDILQILATAFQINTKTNSIITSIQNGVNPSPQQQAYLGNVIVVNLAVPPSNQNLLLTPFAYQLPPPQQFGPNGNPEIPRGPVVTNELPAVPTNTPIPTTPT